MLHCVTSHTFSCLYVLHCVNISYILVSIRVTLCNNISYSTSLDTDQAWSSRKEWILQGCVLWRQRSKTLAIITVYCCILCYEFTCCKQYHSLGPRPKTNPSTDRFQYARFPACYTASDTRARWGLGTRLVEPYLLVYRTPWKYCLILRPNFWCVSSSKNRVWTHSLVKLGPG